MSKTKNQVLVIDRARWLRGPYAQSVINGLLVDYSQLYRPHDRRMCCLGIYLRSCGMKVKDIYSKSDPEAVCRVDRNKVPGWLVDVAPHRYDDGFYISNTDIAGELMEANDSQQLTDRQREGRIRELFARNGVTVKFTGPRLPKVNGKEVRYEHVNKKSKPKDG